MKFRAVVTQYFSFTDSSQNNPSPGVCRQLSRAWAAAGSPRSLSSSLIPHCHHPHPCFWGRAASRPSWEGRVWVAGRWVPGAIPQETRSRKCGLGKMIGPAERNAYLSGAELGKEESGRWVPGKPPGRPRVQPQSAQSRKRWWSKSRPSIAVIHSSFSFIHQASPRDTANWTRTTAVNEQCCGICILVEGGK